MVALRRVYWNFLLNSCLLVVLWSMRCRGSDLSLKDVSRGVNLTGVDGYVSAVADVNNDRFADLLVVKENVCTGLVWKSGRFAEKIKLTRNGTIHSVLPADYDGDGAVDILISSEESVTPLRADSARFSLSIYWGPGLNGHPTTIATNVTLPSLVDVNLDLLADVIVTDDLGIARTLCGTTMRSFADCSEHLSLNSSDIVVSNPSYFLLDSAVPVISNLALDSSGTLQLSRWTVSQDGDWHVVDGSPSNLVNEVSVVGMETWQDMDLDGTLDIVVPVCWDALCHQASVLIFFMLPEMSVTMKATGNYSLPVHLDSSRTLPFTTTTPLPPAVRCGDMDLDGFIDVFIVGTTDDTSQQRIVYLSNKPCSSCSKGVTRTLAPEVLEIGGSDVFSVSVFDFKGDGIPDVLISTGNTSTFSVRALQQRNYERNAFVKVIVASCVSGNCTSEPGTTPFGTTITYENSQQSNVLSSTVPILSQVGTMTLQLPAAIFGLGRPTTYARSLEVMLPSTPGKVLSHRWPAIIPNSKVLIVATPPQQPTRWEARLLLDAGQAVWETALVFTGICAVLALIFLFLHRREAKEDELAKREQSHQFHFDAM